MEKDNRIINRDYKAIADELIRDEPELEYIKYSNVNIIYLSSDYAKTKTGGKVLGQCEKIQNKYKWGIPCDFTITVFEPNVVGFTDEQFKILLFHELLHIGIDIGSDGNEVYSVRPHDLEDFKIIVNKFGTDWDRR